MIKNILVVLTVLFVTGTHAMAYNYYSMSNPANPINPLNPANPVSPLKLLIMKNTPIMFIECMNYVIKVIVDKQEVMS